MKLARNLAVAEKSESERRSKIKNSLPTGQAGFQKKFELPHKNSSRNKNPSKGIFV